MGWGLDGASLEHALHVAGDGVDLEVDPAACREAAEGGVLDGVGDQVDADLAALGSLEAGSRVNLEIDTVARYVERMLQAGALPSTPKDTSP